MIIYIIMSTKKKCGFDNKTRRCNSKSTASPELCTVGAKNYCKLLKKGKVPSPDPPALPDYSQFQIGQSQGKTQHGISLSLLKSALQKYIRRTEIDKAIKCLLEVETLLVLENADDVTTAAFNAQSTQPAAPFAKKNLNQFGIKTRTNMANRLLVICSEEVNINDNPNLPAAVLILYTRWKETRTDPAAVNNLIQIVLLLGNANKCRLISYLKSTFSLAPCYVKDVDTYSEFYDNRVLQKYGALDKRSSSSEYTLDTFKTHLTEKNTEKLFRCLGVLCKDVKGIKGLFRDIWKYILTISQEPSIVALHEIYRMMTHQETPIYLYHALLLILHADRLDWSVAVEVVKTPTITLLQSVDEIRDEYVVDQHVKGSKTLASHIKLLKESFYIDPERLNEDFLEDEYVSIYRDVKIGVGYYEENKVFPTAVQLEFYIKYYFGPPLSSKDMEAASKMRELDHLLIITKIPLTVIENSEIFEAFLGGLPLAQQRTSRNKKFTYIDFDKERIIKGPYSRTDFAMITALKYNFVLELLDKNTKSKTGWKWKELLQDGENYYMVTDFVSDNYMKDAEERKGLLVHKDMETWVGGKSYYYFERNSKALGYRIKDLVDDDLLIEDNVKNTNIKKDTLQHFYLRYILGIGDTHVSNVLAVDKPGTSQVIAGIDLEEMRNTFDDTGSILKLLIGKEVKKQKALFDPYLYNITLVNWAQPKLKGIFNQIFLTEQVNKMLERDAMLKKLLAKEL